MNTPTPTLALTALLLTGTPALAQIERETTDGPQASQRRESRTTPTWDSIDRVLAAEERGGFAGTVLLIRDGEVFLNEAYGLADRENNTPNTPDTIFALGSTPIDFTNVAVLQLLAAGKLDLDDPISAYFDDMPDDRGFMTLADIRNSSSGLPDFPFIRGVDADEDHGELSRDEFIERVRTAKLHRTPGTGDEHSHFAWGILAAVIEIVSGQTYEDYVQQHILTPAGMTRTGANGQAFPGETVAVGYGYKSWGPVNTPPQWGPTSWLVKGSGGMVGTTGDLFRFHQAIDRGDLIPQPVMRLYPEQGFYANGDMYGFETWYNYGPGDRFYINCNSSNPMNPRTGYNMEPIAESLAQLVADRPPARFSIGIAFGLEDTGQGEKLVAARVIKGSPADEAGLKQNDVLVSANGTPFDLDDPLAALRPGTVNGDTLLLVVTRGGQQLRLTLNPTPRDP